MNKRGGHEGPASETTASNKVNGGDNEVVLDVSWNCQPNHTDMSFQRNAHIHICISIIGDHVDAVIPPLRYDSQTVL